MNENEEKVEEKKEEKTIELEERVDIQTDPILYIFWKHLNSGLMAFSNTNISAEDAYMRYEKLIKMGYRFLVSGFENAENTEEKSEIEINDAIKKITEILLKRKRKIKVSLTL